LFDAYEVSKGAEERRETTLNTESETKESELRRVGEWLAVRNQRPVLVTRGSSGSILIEINGDKTVATAIPAVPVAPPIDICGAGDATNAGFVFAKALGFSLAESAFLAGVVSSITIKQIGVTGTASVKQILDGLGQL
jgi:sugar/nucleoside kinase (ribokinase family)